MKANIRFWVIALVAILFVLSLALVPGGMSASDPKENNDRSASTKPESKSREGAAESESVRERVNRPTPIGAQPSSSRRPGALKRIANFFKGVFVPSNSKSAKASEDQDIDGDDPDLPAKRFMRNRIDKGDYLRLRDEYIGRLRGIEPGSPFDPTMRGRAIEKLEQQQSDLLKAVEKSKGTPQPLAFPNWAELGPRPISNGQSQPGTTISVTGRVTSVVVDPTNNNKVYLGTAQGGVWRSTNGGTTWVNIFDNAQSLSIGALALAPSNPSILYIGTGEPNLSVDSFFGVGLYRIDNADTTTGALVDLIGPINPAFSFTSNGAGNPTINTTCFGGRSISQIIVHPTDPATIFVSTTTGASGSGANSLSGFIPPLALVGVYRSTNATSAPASVTFQKLAVATAGGSLDTPATGNRRMPDMALEPGNPNNLLVSCFGNAVANDGGIFRSTNALAATPSFTQTLTISATRINFAIQKTGGVVTVLAATSETPGSSGTCGAGTGQLRKSIDGGVTWPAGAATAVTGGILTGADGYCGGQCFYNVVVAMDPNTANTIYIGGNARGTCSDAMKKSSDGVTFTRDDTALHADTHALFITATSPTVFEGNDGGIWKRDATLPAGTPWTDLNSNPLGTMQFESLAVHPTDTNFTIGGTQDNGTEAQQTSPGNWTSAEGGDGGFSLIDQSATDTGANLIAMYHTFFNQRNNLIGFDRAELGSCLAIKDGWESRGFNFGTDPTPSCDGTAFAASNGIVGSDFVLFYAPMALGPGSPNTLYFGTTRLYRSTNRGDTMTPVSQTQVSGTSPISAIGISRQNDNVRIVGTQDGNVFATTTGANPLPNTSFPIPANATTSVTNRFIGRAVVDPNNANIAYVTLSYFTATATDAHVWTTSNLNGLPPTWTALPGTGGNVIPNIPVNAFVVDPANSNNLYAGTDIGVYSSSDRGKNWAPFGVGLPRVAVFDMAIQPTSRILRVATHGRGMWEISLVGAPTAANGSVTGTITDASGAPVSGVPINLSGTQTRETITDGGGRYGFDSVETNGFYTVTPSRANYTFTPENRSFSLLGVHTEASFTATANGDHANAIDTTEFFVRQHYLDFLNREPDGPGLAGWVSTLNHCAAGDNSCDRVHVSEAFYRSQEFQERGYFAYRFYSTALGRKPDYAEFAPDLARVSGFLTNDQLEAAKTAFIDDFMTRPAFALWYNSLSNSAFVDELMHTAGVNLSNRQTLIDSLNNKTASRAEVLRQIAESSEVYQKYYNQAFVVMEYFGYLHRDPDALYTDWIRALDANPADSRRMVDGFVNSAEYRNRFVP